MTQEWTIEGDYVEACNCDVACQCIWLEPPDDDVCTVSLAWRIREGNYGDVYLGGLSVGMLISTEEGVMFGPDTGWDVVLLIDEAADDDQYDALEDIYFGRAGGIWAAVADAHVESAEVVTAPIDFSRDGDDFSVEIGEVMAMDASGTVGFNEELGTIMPHPLTKNLRMGTGKSTTATVSYDDRFEWDVSGNNAYLGDFELANT
ncbi:MULTISPECIES: DUF1326 domain-containing protein [unclassified Haladaptatus]|uniref:DUF1326 domain-containing protein n=1 Tax=unclassified Haladaptatus TaxID=2622732 RepID=UPI00209BD094|nr:MULTISPECIES: DUF1326 domain-containing protein [unclassified Haladaptatus]MCO8245389.1 DUF1326 domain-containing protein [Haladaptatus sp. AB643]MCO8256826.1 DUF1326 domain-containing protein [Haladaptatus sp. AB618]